MQCALDVVTIGTGTLTDGGTSVHNDQSSVEFEMTPRAQVELEGRVLVKRNTTLQFLHGMTRSMN